MVLVYSWNISGEPFYIGIGSKQRAHRRGRNPYCNNVRQLAENSDCFEVKILEDNLTREQACEREEYYIRLFGRRDNGTGCLTNLTWGGDGVDSGSTPWNKGKQRTEQTKEKLSKAAKKAFEKQEVKNKNLEHLKRLHEKNKGTKRSKETIERMRKGSQSKKARKYQETKGKNISVDGITYCSRVKASQQTEYTEPQLKHRAKSEKYPNIYYVSN